MRCFLSSFTKIGINNVHRLVLNGLEILSKMEFKMVHIVRRKFKVRKIRIVSKVIYDHSAGYY